MNHNRTNTDLYTIAFIAAVLLLILAAADFTSAFAQASVNSPDGGRNFAHPAASTPADTAHGADTPNPDTDTPTPDPGPDPEPDPDPVNPCGAYTASGPHPCPGNDDADPTPTPPQDGEHRRR